MSTFPPDFLWGASISAHAVEGGHYSSDWWRWEQRPGRIAGDATSQTASDHWNRFREDIALARKLGLGALSVSLEWSRIMPREGEVDPAALEHYGQVLEAMRAECIKPIVALYDVTLPEWFASGGGWLRNDGPGVFEAYAQRVASALGSLSRYWVPLMTPVDTVRRAHLWGLWPPGQRSMRAGWKALRHMAAAHAAAFRAFRQAAPEARIGASVLAEVLHPADASRPWDLRAAQWERALSNTVWPHALTSGEWPKPFGNHPALADTADFIGISYYGAQHVRFRPWRNGIAVRVTSRGERAKPHEYDRDANGLTGVLTELAAFEKPLVVLGNGIATEDDRARRHYLLEHVAAVQRALEAGIEVKGYMHRSLLDGFEWERGYDAHYGLVHVHRETLARTPNPAAYLYRDIAGSRGIGRGALARYCPNWDPPEGLDLL